MLAPDTILQGRYRIIRQLGQGGMGAVYEALDERLDTTVALKETLFTDERLRRQFEREARLLARLHHPALPRVSDHFSENDGQFLVMQFISGDDLSEMMSRRQGPFPISQVVSWADQLLDALDYLHTQDPQIIHRDIKPQNLKLTARGQIILLDFGLAKGQGGDISRVTAASIFGYTPNYAPLEQIQGLGTDLRSDLYSLAATLYHLLTGVKPPDALSRAAALVNGQADPLVPASQSNAAVTPQLEELLQRAMSQNRDQRYSSANEMRRALHAGEQGTTIHDRSEAQTVLRAPPSTTVLDTGTEAISHQPTVATGETTVVRGGVIGERKRALPWVLSIAALVVVAVGVFGFVALNRQSSTDQVSPTPVESPSVQPTATPDEVAAESATPEEPSPTPAEQVVTRKTEKAPVRKPTPERDSEESAEVQAEQHQEPGANAPVPPSPNRVRRPGNISVPGGPVIRSFPDGSQIITMPDGTRVYTDPSGRRRVLPPPRNRRSPAPRPTPTP